MPQFSIWDSTANPGVCPPMLVPLLGMRIYRAWTGQGELLLKLEGGRYAKFGARPPQIDPDMRMEVVIEIGQEKDPLASLTVDRIMQRARHVDGKTFTGLDVDVVLFDDRYGAKLAPGTLQWVKVAE